MKWLSQQTTTKLISQLLSEIHKPGPSLIQPPSPIFISKIQTQMSPKGQTPPRSPSGDKFLGRTLSPHQTAALLEPQEVVKDDSKNLYLEKFAKTDTEAVAKLVKSKQQAKPQPPPQPVIPSQ